MKPVYLLSFLLLAMFTSPILQAKQKPVRVGVVGLVHGHVHWILGREDRGDIEIVGIAEPNQALSERLRKQYNMDTTLFYDDVEDMLDAVQPEAVVVFTSIYDHQKVVEWSARRGIHVMVEKPLAFSLEQARAMEAAAKKHNIHLLTNYETTWYGSVHETKEKVDAGVLGALRKFVVHDGHPGPKEIGVGQEFLDWLTDPALNGGGALIDFGCYGANLITWLMENQRPLTVSAITQQIKPHIYDRVDDEATIIVTYPAAQGIIQASWNWPFSRKDMEVYGVEGYVIAPDGTTLRTRMSDEKTETTSTVLKRTAPFDDPFSYFAAVIRGNVDPAGSLSSLENNMIVVEILDAARASAASGQVITLKP